MTKTEKKSETISTWNKAQPFGNTRKEWPHDDNKIKVKLANPTRGATFDEYIRVIDSSEHGNCSCCGYRTLINGSGNM